MKNVCLKKQHEKQSALFVIKQHQTQLKLFSSHLTRRYVGINTRMKTQEDPTPPTTSIQFKLIIFGVDIHSIAIW